MTTTTTTWKFFGLFGGDPKIYTRNTDSDSRIPASFIEEELCILWELEPSSPDWKRMIGNPDPIFRTSFQYGAYEEHYVLIIPSEATVIVTPM